MYEGTGKQRTKIKNLKCRIIEKIAKLGEFGNFLPLEPLKIPFQGNHYSSESGSKLLIYKLL